MDLTFQLPMQYCSLQLCALPAPPDTTTTERHFPFGSASSFFLELFLHLLNSILASYWPGQGGSSFSVMSFCLFILLMVFSRQEYWSGLPLPSPVDHVFQARISRDVCFSRSVFLDDMLSALAILLLVHIERFNLHGPSDVGQYVAGGWGKGSAEVVGKWVRTRLELMLEDS